MLGQSKKVALVYNSAQSAKSSEKAVGDVLIDVIEKKAGYLATDRTTEFRAALKKEPDFNPKAMKNEQVAKVGKQMGVQAVCMIKIATVGEQLSVSARLVDVATATATPKGVARPMQFDADNLADVKKTCELLTASLFGAATSSVASNTTTTPQAAKPQAAPAPTKPQAAPAPAKPQAAPTPAKPQTAPAPAKPQAAPAPAKSQVAPAKPQAAPAPSTPAKPSQPQAPASPLEKSLPANGELYNSDGIEMVFVEQGRGGFYIGKYEVTQTQWEKVMGSNPSSFQGADFPVEKVSWEDAKAFIEALNKKTGRTYRLPKEKEWEYAAKDGKRNNNRPFVGSADIDEVAWYSKTAASTTHSVGKKKPNELGLYDMTGNVWEWCEDCYDAGKCFYRSVRGGSFCTQSPACRIPYRNKQPPTEKSYDIGLRLVLEL
ncbi:hypothetical protein FACS1894199_08960 [Bacteroidia bacterium]|nr:hypothetical protein FACS1894199_08960 [Bacteroidia bacterium]